MHYSEGLELRRELTLFFFNKCHVAYTDISYKERLRELWMLRYLNCPFTRLTAILVVELEDVLRERLFIPNAIIFRKSTAQRTIRYRVICNGSEAPSEVGSQFVERLQLPSQKRGVVYVRSYMTSKVVSEALQCSFYKA